jgi:uncharacterized membrane protein required for colicin V production
MNWIDFLVSALVLIPAISGFRNGLIAGLLRGVGILGGVGLVIWKMPLLTNVGVTTLGCQKSTVPLLVLAFGVVAGWLLGTLAGWAWKKASQGTEIGFADRAAGFAVGALKGSLLALVVLAGMTIAMPSIRPQVQQSWIGRHAVDPAVKSTRTWMEGRIEAWRK